jgi:hypothetical protein
VTLGPRDHAFVLCVSGLQTPPTPNAWDSLTDEAC